ncbi:amidohydrolase family protein [Cryptosporangium minutisporangium]|uniref:Amidohydrolase-related domain-containing protein n=1 Tax=Cryptosporangium minutisporangium TaxID=113569 RepID=A0ABP6T9Q4_9ACTN
MSAVDFHARLPPAAGARDDLLRVMDDLGIGRAAVSAGGLVDLDRLSELVGAGAGRSAHRGGRSAVRPVADNDFVLRNTHRSGGRLLPFFFADPATDVAAYAAEAPSYRGLEISPAVHGVRLDDPGVRALVATAEAARHPVYVVCLGRPGTRAADLVTLARAFPAVDFVFGHCGFTGLDVRGLATIAPQPNIVAETSGCFTAVARLALHRLGPDRVLFGTEYPLQHPRVELAKLAALDLAPAVLRKVTSENALRLLGEET